MLIRQVMCLCDQPAQPISPLALISHDVGPSHDASAFLRWTFRTDRRVPPNAIQVRRLMENCGGHEFGMEGHRAPVLQYRKVG